MSPGRRILPDRRPPAPRRRRGARAALLAVGLVVLAAATGGPAWAQPEAPPQGEKREIERSFREAERERRQRAAMRDSLRLELQRYAQIAGALRDSVALRRGDADALERQEELGRTVDELSQTIEAISQEIAGLDLQVFDNTILLRDKRGGAVSIKLPPNIDETVSHGLSHLSRVILDELPDTIRVAVPSGRVTAPPAPSQVPEVGSLPPVPGSPPQVFTWGPQPRKRRVIEGDLVKVRDDAVVKPEETVRGDVVAVLGDALVEGHVDGDVVVVLGDLQLGEDAVVAGRVVSVLGRLDRADAAEVGSLVVVNPGSVMDLGLDDVVRGRGGGTSFLVGQLLFALVVLLIVVLLAWVPRARLARAVEALERRPAECLGLGVLVAVAGHLVAAIVCAVLVLTVIGIPVALLLALGLALLDLLAIGLGCAGLGRRLCDLLSLSCSRPWAMAALAMCVVHLPSFVSSLVSWQGGSPAAATALLAVGGTLKAVVFFFGTGALVVSRIGTRAVPAAGDLAPATAP